MEREQFPPWVPIEAVNAAQDHWLYTVNIKKGDWLQSSFGLSYEDARRATLRYPRKIIDVNYKSFTEGDKIIDHFNDFNGKHKRAYGFAIYTDDRLIGSIDVYFQDGTWLFRQINQRKGHEGSDIFSPIYERYSGADDVVIYQKFDGAFFVTKADSILEVFDWDQESRVCRSVRPKRHMRETKVKIEEIEKSRRPKLHRESP